MKRRTIIWRWILPPLFLGLLTTIAVAWALAAWLPQRNWNERLILDHLKGGNQLLFLTEYRTVGAVRRTWEFSASDGLRFAPYSDAISTPTPRGPMMPSTTPISGIFWGRLEVVRSNPPAFAPDGCEHATGWPVLAAWYELQGSRAANSFSFFVKNGLSLEEFTPWRGLSDLRALPFRPIWLGLILDTLFYALLWLPFLGGISAARRALRRRRGQCVRCGYSRVGIADDALCPECGGATPAAMGHNSGVSK